MNMQVTTTYRSNCYKAFYIAILTSLLIGAIATSARAAAGVFIYRQSSAHPVGNSVVMEYNSYKRWEALTVFKTPKGVVKITKFQPLQILPYINPQASGAELRSSSAEYWRSELNTYKHALNTYPKSKVYLAKQVAQLETIVTNLSSGNAWFEGKWVKDTSIAEIRAKRRAEKRDKANRKAMGVHNKAIEVKIAEKKKLLSSTQSDITELTNLIDSKRQEIEVMNAERERAKSTFNTKIMQLLNSIK